MVFVFIVDGVVVLGGHNDGPSASWRGHGKAGTFAWGVGGSFPPCFTTTKWNTKTLRTCKVRGVHIQTNKNTTCCLDVKLRRWGGGRPQVRRLSTRERELQPAVKK